MNLDLNMNALVASLEKLRVEVSTNGKREALRAGARVVRTAMVSRAPVLEKATPGSSSLDPGDLKAGIRSTLVCENGEPMALIGPSSKVDHVARWVEFGHRQVRGGYLKLLGNGKTRGPGTALAQDVPAHPFLRPAYEESIAPANEAMRESLAATIQRTVI